MKARKKPVEIDYFPYGTESSKNGLKDFVKSFGDNFNTHFEIKDGKLFVKTLEGTSYNVTNDDYIIRGVNGEYYPCKIDIFEKTYDVI